MPPARPLITLLTDFGDRDYFVASMKGVILSIHPAAQIVDLSHQIAPQQIQEAGYVLHACYGCFPEGTIHVAVVDPGVGSGRRALLATTTRYHFLAPDNGLLTRVLQGDATAEVRRIDGHPYRRPGEGATFDGRDLFAPAAAWLSKGTPPERLGPLMTDPVLQFISQPARKGDALIGCIDYVDRFGNLISNITTQDLESFGRSTGKSLVTVRFGDHAVQGLVRSYSDGLSDTPAVLVNSGGRVEVFVNGKSAARHLRLGVGDEIILC